MTVEELRGRIDVIDDQLVALLNARAACAIEIGRLKRDQGLPVYQPEREQEVLGRTRALTARLGGPLTEDAIGRLFERIIDEARQMEAGTGQHDHGEDVRGTGRPGDRRQEGGDRGGRHGRTCERGTDR